VELFVLGEQGGELGELFIELALLRVDGVVCLFHERGEQHEDEERDCPVRDPTAQLGVPDPLLQALGGLVEPTTAITELVALRA